MKIAFITGSLEPGRCGVGDYTRLLANACMQLGVETQALALNDLFTSINWNGKLDDVPSTRLTATITWQDRWNQARRFIDRFEPDWISIQFVPYAFHSKGIFKEFVGGISELVGKRQVQIKFHEIWIGEYPRAPIKEKLVGRLQKKLTRKLLKSIKPKYTHCTSAGALTRMKNAEMKSSYLPIFGNINVSVTKEENWLFSQLDKANKAITKHSAKEFLWYGFFGSLHENWPARQILERLRMFTTAQNKRPGLLHAGIIGKGRKRWRDIKRNYTGDWLIHSLGELDEDEISKYLLSLDYGLTSTPWDIIGKSGTVAAMVEHGLPVIVNVDGGTPDAPLLIQDNFKQLIIKGDEMLLQNLRKPLKHEPTQNNKYIVAQQFLNELRP